VQSPNPTESGEHSHYSFHSAVSVPNSPYPHHVNNPSTYYYHRQENASYISSPNPQPMSLNSSLPYISKMSQMPSTSRRQNMSPPSHELLPISNRSRLQSPGLSTRYGNMSLIKSDSPDPGPEIPRPPKPEASNAPQCTVSFYSVQKSPPVLQSCLILFPPAGLHKQIVPSLRACRVSPIHSKSGHHPRN
jgi:hypothetical protein